MLRFFWARLPTDSSTTSTSKRQKPIFRVAMKYPILAEQHCSPSRRPPRESTAQTVIMKADGKTTNSNGAQTLLIDADDTLWENNIYFERAIARFISFLNHREYSAEQVREILNDVERENIVTHGYGLHSFAHALVATFERLSVARVTPQLHAQIHSIAHTIADHPVEILPEVPATLEHLYESATSRRRRCRMKRYCCSRRPRPFVC